MEESLQRFETRVVVVGPLWRVARMKGFAMITAALAPMLAAAMVLKASPGGKYCGSVEGVVDVSVDIATTTAFNLKATIMGSQIECNGEPYKFSLDSGKVTIPGIDNPDDCIGKVADEFGITADTVDITYNANSNSIKIDIGFGAVELKPCGTANHVGWEVLLKPHHHNFHRFHPHPKPVDGEVPQVIDYVDVHPYHSHHGHHHHCHCKACALAGVVFFLALSLFVGKRLRKRCSKRSNNSDKSVLPASSAEMGVPLVSDVPIKH